MKTKLHKMRLGVFAACLAIAGWSTAQTTYTFTNGAASGNVGPTQVMMDAEYAGTTLDGDVTVTGGIQFWTVPVTGNYSIEAFGGQGFGDFGGRGAHIYGEFNLTAGTVLKILVGQQAGPYLNFPATTYNGQFGGGGGSFVTDAANTPLVVAGGGGGNHGPNYVPQSDGQITEAGADGANAVLIGLGGTGGNGGLEASSADGGGGFFTNGTGLTGGQAFVNGGLGGSDEGTGGFGGGGGTSSWNNYRGGGGGGYSGGGGGNNNASTCCPAGGGGGSFNAGTNQLAFAGVQLGDGLVVITSLCAPTAGSLTPDALSLADATGACVVDPLSLTPPTASNSCAGASIEGTPDITAPINAVGTTVLTWTFDDGTNVITQTQDVVITGIDTDPPVIDNPNLLNFSSQCSFTPPTPTATDFCQGTINGTPDVTFPITTPGTTTITWTYDDGFGNTVTQTQDITINDVSAPSLDVPNLEVFTGCNAATPPAPTATDNCAGTLNGVPDVTFPITTLGTTVVTWTYDDGNGNTISQTQNVNVTTINNVVTVNGTTLAANGNGLTYQWIDCATGQAIAGATNQSFTATTTGEYAVVVSNTDCVDTSACNLIDFTGISELNSDRINIYPNPTNDGVFTVDFDGNMEQIALMDAVGRVIEVSVNLNSGQVDASALAAGNYTVTITTAEGVYTKGLVIVK